MMMMNDDDDYFSDLSLLKAEALGICCEQLAILAIRTSDL